MDEGPANENAEGLEESRMEVWKERAGKFARVPAGLPDSHHYLLRMGHASNSSASRGSASKYRTKRERVRATCTNKGRAEYRQDV